MAEKKWESSENALVAKREIAQLLLRNGKTYEATKDERQDNLWTENLYDEACRICGSHGASPRTSDSFLEKEYMYTNIGSFTR